MFGADLDGSRPLVGEITRRSPSAALSPGPALVGNVLLVAGSTGGQNPNPHPRALGDSGTRGGAAREPKQCHHEVQCHHSIPQQCPLQVLTLQALQPCPPSAAAPGPLSHLSHVCSELFWGEQESGILSSFWSCCQTSWQNEGLLSLGLLSPLGQL